MASHPCPDLASCRPTNISFPLEGGVFVQVRQKPDGAHFSLFRLSSRGKKRPIYSLDYGMWKRLLEQVDLIENLMSWK